MSEQVLFRAKGICKSFPGVKALQNVKFDLKAGEVHARLGENGAGKSTFIKILGGNYRPDKGTIEIDGETVTQMSIHESRARGISIVHQELCLAWNMRVYENIMLGREITKGGICRERDMIEYASTALKNLNLNIDPMAMTSELSTGKRQMIEIAKAVSYGAKIIVMDEPTSSLSDNEVDALFETIYTLKARGVGIIYISHRLEELATIADRVTVLRDGQWTATVICHSGKRELYENMMVGREMKDMYMPKRPCTDQTVLKVTGLSSGKVNNISFDVKKGEILGFFGLVGAGRTELMDAIFGVDKVLSGSIELNGKKLHIHSPKDAMNHKIALVPEERKRNGLVLIQDLYFNTSLCIFDQLIKFGRIDRKRQEEIMTYYKDKFKIKTPSFNQMAGNLSGGNQQKVVLSKELSVNPMLLILDEPTRGIDVGAKAEIYRIISDLAAEGMSVICVSSELPEIINLCHRVCVMANGKIVKIIDDPAEMTQNRIMEYALGGKS
mgnify:CR=1 FL=1